MVYGTCENIKSYQNHLKDTDVFYNILHNLSYNYSQDPYANCIFTIDLTNYNKKDKVKNIIEYIMFEGKAIIIEVGEIKLKTWLKVLKYLKNYTLIDSTDTHLLYIRKE